MPYHIFRDENRIKHLTIVNTKGMAHEIWSNHRAPRPRLDRLLASRLIQFGDLLEKMPIYEWSFFDRTSHSRFYLRFIGRPSRRTKMNRFEVLCLFRVL